MNLSFRPSPHRRRVPAVCALLGLLAASAEPGLAEDAGAIASTVCVTCHGTDGNSVAPMFPKLAGQHPEYLSKQLREFVAGKRKNEIMAPVIAGLDGEDITALAAHYASQRPEPAAAVDARLGELGRRIYEDGNEDSGLPACVGCHQPGAAGSPRFPRLAGQFQDYLLRQLAGFKYGSRTNDSGRLMRTVAARMNEQEMKAVAEYLAGLR